MRICPILSPEQHLHSLLRGLHPVWTDRIATVLYVHITQHTQLRASPLYEAVMSSPRIHRMCVLSTLDHVHWESLVYEDFIPAN